ncbi:uncharacterized protein [Dermacentor albipictus]|uniref:uncharacterized protein isoform X1 n=1 Tax=Dermacentor albipictus TaxID=60249 RepID=UPI0038FBEA01
MANAAACPASPSESHSLPTGTTTTTMATGSAHGEAGTSSGISHQAFVDAPLPEDYDSMDETPEPDAANYESFIEHGPQPSAEDPGPSDPAWEYAISKTRAKKLRRAARRQENITDANQPVSGQTFFNNPSEQTRKQGPARRPRLPPLPKGDIKIVIRPTRGLNLREFPNHVIAAAVTHSCPQSTLIEGKYIIRPHLGSNIIVVSTQYKDVAATLRQLTHLTLGNKIYPLRAYVPFSPQLLRVVIHGLDPRNTRETLMQGLWTRDTRIKILDARILGSSTTALLTMDGPNLPKLVYHGGCEYPCYQYRPARQFCQYCMQAGHRPDVCPNPNLSICRGCGMPSPPEDHTCQRKCGFCGGPHVTSSRECHQCLKPARSSKPQEQQKRHVSRKDASQTKNRQRWFSSEDQDGSTQHRNVADTRSTSRKRAASKQRNESATRSHAPNQSKATANTGSREQQPLHRPITQPLLTQQHDTQLASKQKQAPQVPGGANHSTSSHRSSQQGPRPMEQEQDERNATDLPAHGATVTPPPSMLRGGARGINPYTYEHFKRRSSGRPLCPART